MKYPLAIQNLIDQFSELPTVGPKTAERYVFYLLKQNPEKLKNLAQAIAELKEKTTICQTCLAISESNPCQICSDVSRNKQVICIVANTQNMLSIEATGEFKGLYHILGGLINTIESIKPEQLNIKQLIEKVKQNKIPQPRTVQRGGQEIILALDPTLEGETTAMYLVKLLKPCSLKITRLAKGLPMGTDLEYADEMTLANALKNRTNL